MTPGMTLNILKASAGPALHPIRPAP
jgi:hypothetical protein